MTDPTGPSVIILRYGEISLKTTYVRTSFENRLITNIKTALKSAGLEYSVTRERGRIYLITNKIPEATKVLKRISGIVSFSSAIQTTADLPTLTEATLILTKPLLSQQVSFALRVTRTGKHPYTSQDVARHIGAAVATATHAPVDLTIPDHEIFIEIRGKKAFLFTEKHRGIGGLPVGTQGTAAVLCDSPAATLAAWYMMHRGCSLILIGTHPADTPTLQAFLTRWNLTGTPFLLDPATPEFYDRLNNLIADYHCDALATPATRDDPQETLRRLTELKTHISVPLLTPVIALTTPEVERHCKEKEVSL